MTSARAATRDNIDRGRPRIERKYYAAGDAGPFKRSLPSDVVSGEDVSGVKSHIDYPSIDQSIERGPRGVNTSTESDELGRPIHITSSGTDDLAPEERFGYDGNGRLVRHAHKQGAKMVEEGYEYDVVDRVTRRTIYDGPTEIESTHTDYFVAQTNAITTTLPGGGTITNTIDTLGRVSKSETSPNHPNATPMVTTTLYDIEDNPVFVTDDERASVSAYDSVHRVRQTLTSDGTRTDLTLDGWNRTRSATTKNGAQTLTTYSANFVGPQLQHVDDNARKQDFTWDGAGRTNSVVMTGADQPRASQTVYDIAGRVVSSTFGESATVPNARAIRTLSASISREFGKVENDYGTGNTELPVTTTSTEDATHKQTWTLNYDTLGQNTHAGINGKRFDFDHRFDESGNVTSSKIPARRGETTYDYDARSFNTAEHLPGPPPATNVYAPEANGVLKQYTDPTGEPTKVTNDGIGRPVRRDYADRTFEEIHYDGTRVDFTRDRQNREQHFAYDEGGRLFEVKNANGIVLDHIDYENGRVIRWRTPDTSIDFSDFDLDNHPQQITQHRLDASGNEIDTYSINHRWNDAGELMRTGMPSYQGMNAGTRWASSLEYSHDANGSVRMILRNGAQLMTAGIRSAGRPIRRDLTLRPALRSFALTTTATRPAGLAACPECM